MLKSSHVHKADELANEGAVELAEPLQVRLSQGGL